MTTKKGQDQIFTISEAAQFLSMDNEYLQELIDDKLIPTCVFPEQKDNFFLKSTLIKWVRDLTVWPEGMERPKDDLSSDLHDYAKVIMQNTKQRAVLELMQNHPLGYEEVVKQINKISYEDVTNFKL